MRETFLKETINRLTNPAFSNLPRSIQKKEMEKLQRSITRSTKALFKVPVEMRHLGLQGTISADEIPFVFTLMESDEYQLLNDQQRSKYVQLLLARR